MCYPAVKKTNDRVALRFYKNFWDMNVWVRVKSVNKLNNILAFLEFVLVNK